MAERPASELARVIAASGLPVRRFARIVLARGDRTVRRWLAEGVPPEIEAWASAVVSVELDHDGTAVLVRTTVRDPVPGAGRPALT